MQNTPLKLWHLKNSCMQLEIQSLAGMIGPWKINNGNQVITPLAVAPWCDDPESIRLPPILQRLRGEWPCVPFGITKPLSDFPSRWKALTDNSEIDRVIDNSIAHGYSSNNHWHCCDLGSDWIDLAIDYPENSPIRRLSRSISLAKNANRLDLSLTVETRTACLLPIGLHPVFSLNQESGSCTLDTGAYTHASTYPLQFEPSSLLSIDQDFKNISCAPQQDGSSIDLTKLPFAENREELVQLHGCDGRIALRNASLGYTTFLNWNAEHFPSCVLWFSNRGRAEYPWNNHHLAIGIEPTCSFFDLNPSMQMNALRPFSANQVWRTDYSMCVEVD